LCPVVSGAPFVIPDTVPNPLVKIVSLPMTVTTAFELVTAPLRFVTTTE
jgi:hypothetical protein